VARRLAGTPPAAAVTPVEPPPPPPPPPPVLDAKWLGAQFDAVNYLGPAELALMDRQFSTAADEPTKLAFAKEVVGYFTVHPEKMRLVASSRYYLTRQPSLAFRLAFIAANYVIGQSAACLDVAEQLATDWPNSFTQILWARVNEDALGPDAEHRILAGAAAGYPDDKTVRLNLIENLIATNRVADANRAVEQIRSFITPFLADEIAAATINQKTLEAAIERGQRFPEGDDDIYTDEMCRNYWTSYYESFVTRRERQHGDRLILSHFLNWVRTVANDVDVMLDFGTLCAQPLYEAAVLAPHVKFIGTDRQEFIAQLNNEAYRLPNLSFDHGDIFEVMERVSKMPGRKAFVHIRTTCTLYPRFVEEIYEAAARLGFEHIYMVENAGLVRTRLEFVDFDTMTAPAVVAKHRLHIHNYRRLLADNGYRVHDFRRNRAPGLWRGDHPASLLGSQYEIHAKRNTAPQAP
jgi:hypothetical protein